MKQWIVSLANYPTPDLSHIHDEVRSRAYHLVQLMREYMPADEADGSGDYEDFMEQAVRLDAALNSFGVENIWLTLNDSRARNLHTGETFTLDKATKEMGRYGIEFRYSAFHTLSDGDAEADHYAQLTTFQTHAGRDVELCGFVPDSGTSVEESLLRFINKGMRKVVIKTVQAKKGFWWLDLPESQDLEELHNFALQELDWTVISLEGRPNSLLVQEVIPMSYEYRVFVINQTPVTSAGCIEEFTPLNNIEQFDPQLRENRAEASPVRIEPGIRDDLIAFANQVTKELALEKPTLRNYVLDVAMSNGTPVVIELNSFSNSGLYANQPQRITDAMKLAP